MEGKMSKEELLKYLIAEIDLIMHDKDYRFENANGTWYSRESCRDLTNEEVFEELRTELRQFADLEATLAEKERQYETLYKLFSEQHEIIDQNELGCFEEVNRLLKEQKDFYIVEKTEYDKMKQGAKDIVKELKQQLADKDLAIENWQTMYESVVQTCHNDKEEIERLNKKLETQENTITNIVEDNRASQEWYRKQLEEKDKEIEYQESMKILAVENQNKKAIEQLEKVKGLIANHTQELWTCENDDIDVVLYEEIDKQINELKGKVE